MSFNASFHVERHTARLEKAPRASRACRLCHTRKVRCDVSPTKPQCSNCQRDGQVCEQKTRQRRTHAAKAKQSCWQAEVQNPSVNNAANTSSGRESGAGDNTTHRAVSRAQNVESELPRALDAEQSNKNVEAGPPGASRGGGEAPQLFPPGAQGSAEENTDQPLGPSPSAGTVTSVSSGYDSGYMERSAYIAPDKFHGEDGSEINYIVQGPSETTHQMAKLQKVFEIPPRAIRESLFENFWTHCYAWDPIVDKSQISGVPLDRLSPLLLQSVFLAGSRMLSPSRPHAFASPQDYYTRAKTLFWLDYEKDPMTLLIAASLMHWWNPHGPEKVSTNTSSFWCRVAVSLAQQMGLHSDKKSVPDESLRRRLWWSIVARDRLISVAHGRPPAICLDDCNVTRPTLDDFPDGNLTGLFFIAYVDLSLIMGRFTQHEIRKSTSKDDSAGIADSLYRWIKNLPGQLRLSSYNATRQVFTYQSLRPYSIECRQLNILYLTTIVLLYRSRTFDGQFPAAAVIAASTMAGVFEDFLARDEVRFLGACFTFHLLAASIALLSCYKYPELWELAQEDLKTLVSAQQEMKKSWPSALGSINSFDRMYKLTMATQKKVSGLPESTLTPYQALFFEDCDMSLCRMHPVLVRQGSGPGRPPDERDQRELLKGGGVAGNMISGNKRNPPMTQMAANGGCGGGGGGGGDGGAGEMHEFIPSTPPYHGHSSDLMGPPKTFLEQGPDLDDTLMLDQIFQEEAGQLNGTVGDWLFWDQLALDAN